MRTTLIRITGFGAALNVFAKRSLESIFLTGFIPPIRVHGFSHGATLPVINSTGKRGVMRGEISTEAFSYASSFVYRRPGQFPFRVGWVLEEIYPQFFFQDCFNTIDVFLENEKFIF